MVGGGELPHIPCPVCIERYGIRGGWVFQDARGGYECTECDARFAIERQPPNAYAGPLGPLSWRERNARMLASLAYAMGGAAGASFGGGHIVAGVACVALGVALGMLSPGGLEW